MSDLGNEGRPNSMKLGKDIGLDELLQNHSLVDFVTGCLQFFGEEVRFRGPNYQKNRLSESQLSVHVKITTEGPQNKKWYSVFVLTSYSHVT